MATAKKPAAKKPAKKLSVKRSLSIKEIHSKTQQLREDILQFLRARGKEVGFQELKKKLAKNLKGLKYPDNSLAAQLNTLEREKSIDSRKESGKRFYVIVKASTAKPSAAPEASAPPASTASTEQGRMVNLLTAAANSRQLRSFILRYLKEAGAKKTAKQLYLVLSDSLKEQGKSLADLTKVLNSMVKSGLILSEKGTSGKLYWGKKTKLVDGGSGAVAPGVTLGLDPRLQSPALSQYPAVPDVAATASGNTGKSKTGWGYGTPKTTGAFADEPTIRMVYVKSTNTMRMIINGVAVEVASGTMDFSVRDTRIQFTAVDK